MNEATLKGGLVKALRTTLPRFTILRHEDRFTGGIPDLSVSGLGHTSWYEVKFANPTFARKGVQDLTLARLADSGLAYYIIYQVDSGKHWTRLVHPSEIENWRVAGPFVSGFNHKWLAQQILTIHKARKDEAYD